MTATGAVDLLDNLGEGVLIVDEDGVVHYSNTAAHHLLNLDRQPGTLYQAVAPFEAWQSLIEDGTDSHLYTAAGRLDIRCRSARWNGAVLKQLVLSRAPIRPNRPTRSTAHYLTALASISQRLSATLRLADIVQAVVSEAVTNTMAGGGLVSLINPLDGKLVPKSSYGAQISNSAITFYQEQVLANRHSLIVNVPDEQQEFSSYLVNPILYEGVVAGLISLASSRPEHFDEPAEAFVNALSNHVAIAMGNSRRFGELNRRSHQLHRRIQQMERVVETSRSLHGDRQLAAIYEDIVYAIQEGVGFGIVTLGLIDEKDSRKPLRTVAGAGLPLDRFHELQKLQLDWQALADLLVEEHALGATYFIPAESGRSLVDAETYQALGVSSAENRTGEGAYYAAATDLTQTIAVHESPGTSSPVLATLPAEAHELHITGSAQTFDDTLWLPIAYQDISGWVPAHHLDELPDVSALWCEGDLFLVPLQGFKGEPIGLLAVHGPLDGRRPSSNRARVLEIFANHAAVAIQNARMVSELRGLNQQLDDRVAERTKALGQERDRVHYLLRITSELTASLDQDHVLQRALELVNEVVMATQGCIVLRDGGSDHLSYQAWFDANDLSNEGECVLSGHSYQKLISHVIENQAALIVADFKEESRWRQPLIDRDHRSVLAVPLVGSDEVLGVLMLFHTRPNAFSEQQLELVDAAATQVARAIGNTQLYMLIHEQAERLGRMLREEQIEAAKNQAILESIADGVMVANAQGRIILANQPASEILNIPRAELIDKSIRELLGLYGTSGQVWLSNVKKWTQKAEAADQHSYVANRLIMEDKVVSAHVSPVIANGQLFGTVSIFRDITKEVEVDRMKSEFVSTVSHELRTPMTSIKGYAELILLGGAGSMNETQIHYLRIIKANADRLSMLVNDLLDISRIETGKTELHSQPLNLSDTISQVVESHLWGLIHHENKPLEVVVDLAPTLPLVHADHRRVIQILTNLLDNAFRYTPATGTIEVKATANGDYVNVSVSDTGIGISRENQSKIFDRFFRVEDDYVQRVAGTGLGLAIVDSLVTMHGGKIVLESKLGQGSTFTFTLPCATDDVRSPHLIKDGFQAGESQV